MIWTIPDHPWVDNEDGASVRVALTVVAAATTPGVRLLTVDWSGAIVREVIAAQLNEDFTATADIASATAYSLTANTGLSFRGFNVVGRGFVLEREEAIELLAEPANREVVRPHLNGRDIAQRSRDVFVIDFGVRTEQAARTFARPFQIVMDRVRPERLGSRDRGFKQMW